MTQKIHLLSPQQAQQIAAGEVIERPANIVKELLENSLDAGAQTITITIAKAGKELIQICDDGCGMSRQDAEMCFARHATSKLSNVDELMSLATFGFRGEALASIAAVSSTTLTTKEHSNTQLGTQVVYDHGVHTKTEEVACPAGTTITIKNLFATIPVRKSFLKQDETEWNQILGVITGLALTHIDRTIKVVKDGTLVLNAPQVQTLKDRLTQVWGHNLTAQLTELVPAESGALTITGYTSTLPYARYGKQQIIFFVNNRLVKNSDLAKAVLKGYKHALPPGKYPATCMMINVDPLQVDVNIHPRKEEVRFTKPGIIARVIHETITRTLESAIENRLAPPQQPHIVQHTFESTAPTAPLPPLPFTAAPQPIYSDPIPEFDADIKQTQPPLTPAPELAQNSTNQQTATVESANTFTVCGQLFATYILIEKDDELIMIDQHAAHERILYHQFAHTFENKQGTQLLFPETITLSHKEVACILQHSDFFEKQGICLHQSGPTQISVTSSPPKLQSESLKTLIADAADFIATHQQLDTIQFSRKLNEHVQSHMACKAAVKAGDALDQSAMRQLVEQLLATPNKFMCVHGRPTMYAIKKTELEKRFRRR